jgi:hypothetical protein
MVYPVLTTLAVVGTANHYLFDVVCGLALGLFALQLFRPEEAFGAAERLLIADAAIVSTGHPASPAPEVCSRPSDA